MVNELSGKVLGKYELVERVGRGGMAEVYKAYHAALDRYVAIKVLHPFLSDDPEFKERFEGEARNVARLKHPNIVQVYDFEFDPNRALYYMVMEHIEGTTLRARLTSLGTQKQLLPVDEGLYIVRCVAQALAYAHQQGMVHRDIKPANVLMETDNRIVLTDFGIARIVSGPNVTASGSMVGTPTYMAPEQGLGHPGDHRSDIYSLGIVLYQLLTGVPPFDADTPVALILKHINEPLPAPSVYNPEIPEGLEQILYKALTKTPEERYQSAEELITHLDDLETATALPVELPQKPLAVAAHNSMPGARYADGTQKGVRRRGRSCLTWVVLLLIAVSVALAGIYVGYAGLIPAHFPITRTLDSDNADTQTTDMSDVGQDHTSYITDGLLASELGSVTSEAALDAQGTQGAVPDALTATATACESAIRLVDQEPGNGTRYPELTTLTLSFALVNDGSCVLDDAAQLVFVDGFQMQGPNFYPFNRALAPGEQIAITLNLRTPKAKTRAPVVRSTWAVIAGNGRQIGEPFVFELELLSTPPTEIAQP